MKDIDENRINLRISKESKEALKYTCKHVFGMTVSEFFRNETNKALKRALKKSSKMSSKDMKKFNKILTGVL